MASENNAQIAEKLKNHFDHLVANTDSRLAAVDWKSKDAQHNRFRELLRVVENPRERFSINDYGCGNGELIDFLISRDCDFDYFGFDVSPLMLEQAREKFGKFANCRFSNSPQDLFVADYTIASGVFNLKFDCAEDDWRNYMREKIVEMWAKSKRGLAFNALTSYSDVEFRRRDLFYADPLEWFDFCKREVSPRVALLHDYPEFDFTIIARQAK